MSISNLIINWYQKNKRDLPWRNSIDPYSIWLSEIILQQTRVNQGLPYYLRFIDAFPTVKDFSKADEEDILKLWQGLGYYSRARNMLKAAKFIDLNYQGNFPENVDDLLKIPGIGPYTANAIASLAFNKSVPVVDGNVFRVIARMFEIKEDIGKKSTYDIFYKTASQLMGNYNPSSFNQAMMELGALVCTPQSPKCQTCPVLHHCASFKNKTQLDFPVKLKKIKTKKRFFNYIVLLNQNNTLIYKRSANDIWQNLWEFPLFETEEKTNQHKTILALTQSLLTNETKIAFLKHLEFDHVLTHQKINALFWIFKVEHLLPIEDKYEVVEFDKINIKFALSRLTDKFLSSYY
jgi:A/G-specific adenine glycosylase